MDDRDLDAYLAKMGTPEEVKERLERLDRLERNTRFASDHMDEWRLQYPDCYVLVFDEKLVASTPSFEELLRLIDGLKLPGGAHVRFVTKEKHALVLAFR
jgi:hypothetical protein